MNRLGIETGLDLRAQTLPFLQQHFGKFGSYYYWIARGVDERPVAFASRLGRRTLTKCGRAAIGIDEHRALLEAEENSGTWRSTDPACNKPVRRASAVRRK